MLEVNYNITLVPYYSQFNFEQVNLSTTAEETIIS